MSDFDRWQLDRELHIWLDDVYQHFADEYKQTLFAMTMEDGSFVQKTYRPKEEVA